MGAKKAEEALQKPDIKDLDASKLTVEKNSSPKDVPEINSEAVWKMRTCSDHSAFPERSALLLMARKSECHVETGILTMSSDICDMD